MFTELILDRLPVIQNLTCHATHVNVPSQPQPTRPVLDLRTPDGLKAELARLYKVPVFTSQSDVTNCVNAWRRAVSVAANVNIVSVHSQSPRAFTDDIFRLGRKLNSSIIGVPCVCEPGLSPLLTRRVNH